MNIQAENAHQELILKDRKTLTLNGVESINDFTESLLSVTTSFGIAYIEGEGMKIENLSRTDGTVLICGRINGFYFKENKKSKGFFSKNA